MLGRPLAAVLASLSSIVLLLAAPADDAVAARVHVRGAACPDVDMADRVRAQLGPDATLPESIEVDGTLRQRDDGQWELELAIMHGDDEPTVRSFVAPHCATAIDAGALVIALAIDPTRGAATTPAPEVPSPPVDEARPAADATSTTTRGDASTASTGASTSSSTEPTPAVPPKRKRKLRGLVRASGGVDGGALPRAAVVFEGAVGAFGRGWRTELTGAYRLQSTATAPADRDAGGHFSLWAIGLRACGVPAKQRLDFPLCLAAEAGQTIADGFGFDGALTARRPWAALAFVPGLAWAIRPNIALVVQAALGVPLVRTVTRIENLDRVHVIGPVYGRGLIGLEGRFP
jgi:hypothetical protein